MWVLWPDGTSCELEELEEYLMWKSDDFDLVLEEDLYVSGADRSKGEFQL